MLLKICEHCSMGCSHCLSNCTKNDRFMDEITLDKSIKFIKSHSTGILSVVVSGGEPTEHPKFKEYLRKIVKELQPYHHIAVIITSNGLWMVEHMREFESLYKEFLYENCGKIVMWQITSDPEFYPKDIYKMYPGQISRLKSMKGVSLERKLRQIYPQGRALENGLKWTAKAPKCFNIRSASGAIESFIDLLTFMSSRNINCVPCIEYDGSLKMGESHLCKPCSDISKSDMEIMQDIRSFKCMSCKEAISCLPANALSVLK